jgi:hypothetical protein
MEGRRSLVTLVVSRPQRTTSKRHQHFSKGAVDPDQSEAGILDLSASRLRSSRHGFKRQASMVIEVPPRPIDWWTWEELHSPLAEKVPKRPSVDPREGDFESKGLQRQKRPRGRPRRTEPPSSIQGYRLKSTQRRKARSTNSPKHCTQAQATSFKRE